MPETKADIIARLQRDILPLQGYKSSLQHSRVDIALGPIKHAFPNSRFPLGAIHEFIADSSEGTAASIGFVAGLMSTLMTNSGASIWISSSRTIFPPALKFFGIAPEKIIFIDLKKERDILWTIEEALKCEGLTSVIGEIQDISFTASRRFQLAVEQSRATGFIIRKNPRNLAVSASLARWKISSLPSELEEGLPGIGFPRWRVELLKVRNGKPGSWDMEWVSNKFRHVSKFSTIDTMQKKKVV